MNKRFLFVLFFSIVLFLCQTVVYSAINSTMNISGSSIARAESDVRINKVTLNENLNSGVISNYEIFTKDTMSIGFSLNESGSIYYDIEIGNYTDNLVGIFSISGIDGVTYSFVDYNIKDSLIDGFGSRVITICFTGDVGSYDLNINFNFKNMYRVDYEGFSSSIIQDTILFEGTSFGVHIPNSGIKNIFVVDSNNAIYTDFDLSTNGFNIYNISSDLTVTNNDSFIRVIKGNIYNSGSEVCLGSECFYVTSSDETSFRLFAKYNLYVGADWDGNKLTSYGASATGIQHPDMRGYIGDGLVRKGVLSFVGDEWWTNSITEYPAYVYNEKSNHYKHVENYRNYLEENGAILNDARLISYEELVELGCDPSSGKCTGDSSSWILYTSFWSGTAANKNSTKNLWCVLGKSFIINTATNVSGVRPLIEINYSDL